VSSSPIIAWVIAKLLWFPGGQDTPVAKDNVGRCILCGRFVRCGWPCANCGLKKL